MVCVINIRAQALGLQVYFSFCQILISGVFVFKILLIIIDNITFPWDIYQFLEGRNMTSYIK